MKIILYGLLAVISFVLSLVAALAMTGNLSQASLDKLSGKEPPVVEAPEVKKSDPVGPLVQQLKKKGEALKAQEQELNDRAAQLDKREQELGRMRSELEALQKQIQGSVQEAGEERTARLKSVAITISEMKPDKAAERLGGLPPDDIAEILNQVKPKERGKIVEALEPDLATRVLRALQESKI